MSIRAMIIVVVSGMAAGLLPSIAAGTITPSGTSIPAVVQATYYSSTGDAMPAATSNTVAVNVDYPTEVSIGTAKTLEDGTFIQLKPAVVIAGTAELGEVFYVESSDRSAGIRVATMQTIEEGSMVVVAGTVGTLNGERQINAVDVKSISTGNTLPKPVGLIQRFLGQPPDTSGLLIKIWGRAYSGPTGSNWFYVDDGSGARDSLGNLGTRVIGSLPSDYIGKLVTVTGICSVEPSDSENLRVIRMRRISDVALLTNQ